MNSTSHCTWILEYSGNFSKHRPTEYSNDIILKYILSLSLFLSQKWSNSCPLMPWFTLWPKIFTKVYIYDVRQRPSSPSTLVMVGYGFLCGRGWLTTVSDLERTTVREARKRTSFKHRACKSLSTVCPVSHQLSSTAIIMSRDLMYCDRCVCVYVCENDGNLSQTGWERGPG